MKTAMLIMGSGAILNIILDPVLILAFGKENGILGAAVATITAQIFQAVLALVYFLKKSETVKIHRIGVVGSITKPVLGVGVSTMLMQVMTMLQQTVMYNTVERYGGGAWQTILSAAALTVLRQILLFLPLVLTLPLVFTNSVEGVFYAQMITDAVVLVLGVIMMAAAFRKLRKDDRVAFA